MSIESSSGFGAYGPEHFATNREVLADIAERALSKGIKSWLMFEIPDGKGGFAHAPRPVVILRPALAPSGRYQRQPQPAYACTPEGDIIAVKMKKHNIYVGNTVIDPDGEADMWTADLIETALNNLEAIDYDAGAYNAWAQGVQQSPHIEVDSLS